MLRTAHLCVAGLALVTASAVSQEDPGQMGTTPPPTATSPGPAKAQKPQSGQQNPTTPTPPQPRANPNAIADIDKPEDAVGGTKPQAGSAPLISKESNAGALSPVQPSADELRKRIEAALQREPSLSNANIVLNIGDDTIDISGNANTPKERLAARRIVQSFAGNRRVRERINVAGVTHHAQDSLPSGTTKLPSGAARPASAENANEEAQPGNRPKKDPEKHGDASDKPR